MKQILVALLFVISQSAVLAQKNAVIDDLLSSYEKINQFSGSVLVAEKGKVIFEKSYGYRNAVKKEKNTNNSKYRIYSTTKVFTTIVILKLQEQGKLSLEDKLSKYFPSYTKGDSITIRNMVSHTSGIPETEESNNEEELLKQLLTKPLDFSVDTKWSYCNTNFYLLGYIIQKVTGQSYEEVIADMILKPFQMTHSGFHFNDLKDENKALGYEFIVGENSNEALRFKSDHPYSAGAMYSTVEDLYKLIDNLRGIINAVEILNKRGFAIDKMDLERGVAKVVTNTGLKGRWQTLRETPKVICDTGHNIAGITENLVTLEKYRYHQLWMILGFVSDKDIRAILEILPKTAKFVFCQADVPRALEADDLQQLAKDYQLEGTVIKDVNKAIDWVVQQASEDDFVYVGGSTFVVAGIHQL